MNLRIVSYILLIMLVITAISAGCGSNDPKSINQSRSNGQNYSRATVAEHGVVAAAHPLAAKAGLEILKEGGNAFDAAVATSFVLGVVEPNASGIGGGGFAVIYVAKENKSYVLDFREVAPKKAHPDIYKLNNQGRVTGDTNRVGWYASAVPGQVAGMELLAKRFGTVRWEKLLQPAIQHAEQGVVISKTISQTIMDEYDRIQKFPSQSFFRKFILHEGLPLSPGGKLVNKNLAVTLKKIAKGGADVFYKGEIADAIVREYARNGHEWITKEDLSNYQAVICDPVQSFYRGYTIATVPPPSSGGLTILEILNILEGYNIKNMDSSTPELLHILIESSKLAFADRTEYMGDPRFLFIPVNGLLNKKYAAELKKRIDTEKANNGVKPGEPNKYESGNTTSFSIVDREGNMVTITQTINFFWGSGVVPEGTGIIMNNEMHDFDVQPGSPNAPEAGKKPLSSMAPILVLKDGKPVMTLGTPGGTRIITALVNVLVQYIDFSKELQQAIEVPRFHNQNGPVSYLEGGISAETRKALEERGHKIMMRGNMDLYFGGAQGVGVTSDGKRYGAADPRRDGAALGY